MLASISVQRGFVSEIFTSFQGEGLFAGRRHLFLRMAGCNIRCVYCDTPGSLVRTPDCTVEDDLGQERRVPNPLDVAFLSSLVAPLLAGRKGVHALAVTGGEPLVQSEFLAALLDHLRPPVPVLLETNGTFPERLPALLPFVDIVSMDLKLPSSSGERAFWSEHRAFLHACRARTLYVKVPVDERTCEEEVALAAGLVAEESPGSPFFLQPIVSPDCGPQVSGARLERFYDRAAERLRDVRVLPQTHKFLGVR